MKTSPGPTRALVLEDLRTAPGSLGRKLIGLLILDTLGLVVLYRISHALNAKNRARSAWVVSAVMRQLFGAEIHPSAKLGRRLKFAHAVGVVIGEGVVAGDDLEIYSNVTLGNRGDTGFPTIGNDVQLFSGCKVIGGVRLGDGCKVGANAVVLKDVPDGATAVGVPAHIL